MSKKLIITEKPSVARDFARVLGVRGNHDGYIENDEYVISWCFGHLVEMVYPESYDIKYKSWKLEDLPFLPKEYKYGVIESAKNQYDTVHTLLYREDIDTVLWAGDSGKEGQTIEENIRNYGGVREGMNELRVWIDSQTDDEIMRGINEAKPMSDYALLGRSGIMRTIEDYCLGINFSRALSVKYGNLINQAAATKSYTAIAVGRVMTCVLGMVVNREREIRNFTETYFYKVVGLFSDIRFPGEWRAIDTSQYFQSPFLYKENGFKKEEDAQKLIDSLTGKDAEIDSVEKSISKKRAPLLFNLAELQSECSKIFKISPAQTLQIAQDLYERKYTTYPRTDARVLTTAIAKEITKNLYGLHKYNPLSEYVRYVLDNKKYIGLDKSMYTDDSKVTDHYAIIPTGQVSGIESMDHLHVAVYELIAKRFLSIFYPPAEYSTVKMVCRIGTESFFTSAKVLASPGYLKVTGIPKEKDNDDAEEETSFSKEDILSLADTLHKGDRIVCNDLSIKTGKTAPPKRYTSGNLILAMENAGNLIEDEELRQQIKNTGIGTSATRGDILDKLVRIKYLNQNPKTQIITPENLGEMIYEVVNLTIPTLLNPEMTASWEKGLEGIINGTIIDTDYREKLEDYIRKETNKIVQQDLRKDLSAKINPFTGKESRGMATRKPLGIPCPICGGELTTTSFGYGCSNFSNDEIKCKFSVGTIAGRDLSEDEFRELIQTGKVGPLSGFVSKSKSSFSAILELRKNDQGQMGISFSFENVPPTVLEGFFCPDCGGKLVQRGSGVSCEHFDFDNPDTCRFYIGKIANKDLPKSAVEELLSEGRTKTIRGFKSKNGKKFDACLVLKKNESGKTEVAFDFDNVEAKVVKGVKCPICGNDIVKTPFGFGCSRYDRDHKDESCTFSVSTVCGVKITEAILKELLQNGITSWISGFKSKSGTKFEAKLAPAIDEQGKFSGIRLVFDDEDKLMDDCNCPKCNAGMINGHRGYFCEKYSRDENGCKFFIGKIAGVTLTEEQVRKLIRERKSDKITGFTGKSGKLFDAVLQLDENCNVVFDFSNNQERK